MTWQIEFEKGAKKEFLKLGYPTQKAIIRYLSEKVRENPRRYGKSLKGTLCGLWRYRIEGYRIVCRIQDAEVMVVVVRVAHRSKVYKEH